MSRRHAKKDLLKRRLSWKKLLRNWWIGIFMTRVSVILMGITAVVNEYETKTFTVTVDISCHTTIPTYSTNYSHNLIAVYDVYSLTISWINMRLLSLFFAYNK